MMMRACLWAYMVLNVAVYSFICFHCNAGSVIGPTLERPFAEKASTTNWLDADIKYNHRKLRTAPTAPPKKFRIKQEDDVNQERNHFGHSTMDKKWNHQSISSTPLRPHHRKLVLVSTLDGKISALDAVSGNMMWSFETELGDLMSSSGLSMSEDIGILSRIVPSLDGGLFKFDGTNLETLPLTAESLLTSRGYKFPWRGMLVGGTEAQTYGIDVYTGQLRYTCTSHGCKDFNVDSSSDEVLVIRRSQKTVRALEEVSRQERWNFSVGEYELMFITETGDHIHTYAQNFDNYYGDIGCVLPQASFFDAEFKTAISSGIIKAVNRFDAGHEIWSYRFDHPISSVWTLRHGVLENLDIFKSSIAPLTDNAIPDAPHVPVVFLGIHQGQMYIQTSLPPSEGDIGPPTRPGMPLPMWRPCILQNLPKPLGLTHTSLGAGKDGDISDDTERAFNTCPYTENDHPTNDIAAYHGNDNYYISHFFAPSYSSEESPVLERPLISGGLNTSGNSLDAGLDEDQCADDDKTFEIIRCTFWSYQTEILGVVIVTCFATLFLVRLFRNPKRLDRSILPLNQLIPKSYSQSSVSVAVEAREEEQLRYQSRYETDYVHQCCLGRGGFGVVFEAKHKVDKCSYAVKRIQLPVRENERDKVFREACVLAKLEHPGIVRYFQAWLEDPPAGWQEERDRSLFTDSDCVSTSTSHVRSSPGLKFKKSHLQNISIPFSGGFIFPPANSSQSSWEVSQSKTVETPESEDDDSSSPNIQTFALRPQTLPINNSITSENLTSDSIIIENDAGCQQSTSNSLTEQSPSTKCNIQVSPSSQGKHSHFHHSSRVYLYIQMQLCQRKSLKEWMFVNVESRNLIYALGIFKQIVNAMEYVHENSLIHRDLKPSNIFFSLEGNVKIGDFGLVASTNNDHVLQAHSFVEDFTQATLKNHTDQVGTQLYMSPEQRQGLTYDHKVDIYSMGMILFELYIPFHTQAERVIALMGLREAKFPSDFCEKHPEELKFIKSLMSNNPTQRPTAAEMVQSEFLNHT